MVIVMLLIALCGIMVPVLSMLVRQQVRTTVQSQRSSVAFQLAEAAVKRGYWKLVEQSGNWEAIKTGGTIVGYNNDVVYSDIDGGTYRIRFTADSSLNQITLVGTGKSTAGNEFRAIEVVYTRTRIQGAIQAPAVAFGGNSAVHWGPLLSIADIDLTGASNVFYPRKRARGAITGNGANGNRDNNPAQSNTDGLEWWSYNEAPGVPDIPTPDIPTYAAQASALGLSYNTYQNWSNYVNTLESNVYYFGAGAKFTGGTHFRGKVICIGNINFAGNAASAGNYATTPPSTAWQEYQLDCPNAVGADTAATNEYPGDGGYHTVTSFNFGTGGGGAAGVDVTFKGFLYVTGSFSAGGGSRFHGAIIVATGGSSGSGGIEVFYDDTLSVEFSNATPSTLSWREIAPTTF